MFRKLKKLIAPERPWIRPYESTATADDIFFCFRLILGRHPAPQEWVGHSAHIGEELNSVVGSYLNSVEFSWRKLVNGKNTDDLALSNFDGLF